MSAAQRAVLGFMALGAATSLAIYSAVPVLLPTDVAPDNLYQRLGYVLPWLILPALCLSAAIGRVAGYRFFNEHAIDGDNQRHDVRLAQMRSILTNTSEQSLLAALTYLALAALLPAVSLNIVPVLAIAFVIGRILFILGYAHGAARRALGFALSFYPSVLGLIVASCYWLFG